MKSLLLCITLAFNTFVHGQEFTIGTFPDTQKMTIDGADFWKVTKMSQFYVDQKSSLNLQFVASLGDMTDWGADYQWPVVKDACNLLVNAAIPFAPCQGNHDWNLDHFKTWFPVSQFESNPNSKYGGSLNDNIANAYYLFSASGLNFIVLVVQTHDQFIGTYDIPSITWANSILEQYSDRRAILITHDFYENRGMINDVIKKHDNLFLAICGHSCGREQYWTETTNGGKTVHCIMTDYQCDPDKGATNRYYTFKPDLNQICAYTYNVTSNTYETDANSQFCMNYDMSGNSSNITLSQASEINEGAENGKTITVTLANAVFVNTLIESNWSISNLPTGVRADSIIRISDTEAKIVLSGNSELGTYAANITNITVSVAAAELVNGVKTISANKGIILLKEISINNGTTWHSYNTIMNNATPQASVTSDGITATLEFYESSNDDGIDQSTLLTTFNTGNHPDAFNNAKTVWATGSYPYAAISTTERGSDAGETNAPTPTAVYDLMMHPPVNSHLTVCAFTVPKDGTYTLTNLAARRVSNNGGNVSLKVFNNEKEYITAITANTSRAWVTDNNSYNFTNLNTEDKIYFALDNDGDYAYDATEIAWSISYNDIATRIPTTPLADEISIYPNPVNSNIVYIAFSTNAVNQNNIEIYNMQGKLLQTSHKRISNNVVEVDIAALTAGVYAIQIEHQVKKLIVE